VTVNGYKVNTKTGTSLSGALPIKYNGTYTITATDNAQPSNVSTFTLELSSVKLGGEKVICKDASNLALNNGSITVDAANMIGGSYDTSLSDPANNKYVIRYEAAVVPGDGTPATATGHPEGRAWTNTWSNLVPGEYTVIIRDLNNPDDISSARQLGKRPAAAQHELCRRQLEWSVSKAALLRDHEGHHQRPPGEQCDRGGALRLAARVLQWNVRAGSDDLSR
jgi:hypothetical protein